MNMTLIQEANRFRKSFKHFVTQYSHPSAYL